MFRKSGLSTRASFHPFNDTYYLQNKPALIGLPTATYLRSTAAGYPSLSGTLYGYSAAGDGSKIGYRTTSVTNAPYLWSDTGSASCSSWPCSTGRRGNVTKYFDAYGNTVSTYNYGDYDVSGDETTTLATYYPNTTKYIVNKPALVQTFQGVGASGTKLSESQMFYDGSGALAVAPPTGLLTQTSAWLDKPTSTYVTTKMTYDANGNFRLRPLLSEFLETAVCALLLTHPAR